MTHPDHVGRDQASKTLNLRDDISPEIGRCRIAVQEHDRLPLSVIVEGHLLIVDFERPFGQCKLTHDVTYERGATV